MTTDSYLTPDIIRVEDINAEKYAKRPAPAAFKKNPFKFDNRLVKFYTSHHPPLPDGVFRRHVCED